MANQDRRLIYGRKIADQVRESRKKFTFDFDEITEENAKIFLQNLLGRQIDMLEIVRKTFEPIKNKKLEYHVDDCQFVKRKVIHKNLERFIAVDDKKDFYLYTQKDKLPNYTAIFYHSTKDVDFKGGIFKFADDIDIIPVKGYGIIFDSKEVHAVTPVTDGERRVTLVKVYLS